MAKSYPIAGIISSWFKACDKLGNGNISIQLLVSYMKRSNHGFLAQRTTHSAIPLTSLPKNTPRKHHARLNFKHLRIYVGLNNRCNCFGIIQNYFLRSLEIRHLFSLAKCSKTISCTYVDLCLNCTSMYCCCLV